MSSTSALYKYGKEWQQRLIKCNYAGEIFLDSDRLVTLTDKYAHDSRIITDDGLNKSVIVVFAVNCAYHFYDDSGFWEHFCRIMHLGNNSATQNHYGTLVESKLRELELLKIERTGPFRFVGAILEQCGVSKKYISQFAAVLNEFRKTQGWNTFLKMSHAEFILKLDSVYCSKYLKNFLVDSEGWQFTSQVAHLAGLYEEGVISLDELSLLSGYQPDFWPGFLAGIRTESTASTGKITILKPALKFLKDDCSFALSFPSSAYINSITKPEARVKWMYPETRLNHLDMWADYYSGVVLTGKGQRATWRSDGWIPDGEPVLFDIRSGLLPRGIYLSPGDYFLLAPDTLRVELQIKESYGPVRFPFKEKYSAYLVNIMANDSVPGYKFSLPEMPVPRIEWSDPMENRLPYSILPMDVFQGDLPDLSISDFEAIEQNVVGLFYDLGGKTGRIRSRKDIEVFLDYARRNAPLYGNVWMSVISRRRYLDFMPPTDTIVFCLLPETELIFEKRLYGCYEDALVTIKCDDSVTAEISGCDRLPDAQDTWRIRYNMDYADGILYTGEVAAGFRIPVSRARLLDSNNKVIRFFTEKDVLSESPCIMGVPGNDIILNFLNTEVETIVMVEQPGGNVIPKESLADLMNAAGGQAHELIARSGASTVATGAILIDPEQIMFNVANGKPNSIAAKSDINLEAVVSLCARITENPCAKINLPCIPAIYPVIDSWLHDMLACAIVFDNTTVTVGGQEFSADDFTIDGELKTLLDSYEQSDEVSSQCTGLIPEVRRWHETLSFYNYKFTSGYRQDLIRVWADELRNNNLYYRSEIYKLDGGSALNAAWHGYLSGNTESAVSIINNMSDADALVADLANILKLVLYIRLGRFSAAAGLLSTVTLPEELLHYTETIRAIVWRTTGVANQPSVTVTFGDYPVLPLSEDDCKLLKSVNAMERNAAQEAEQEGSKDWLYLYYLLNMTQEDNNKTLLARRLSAITGAIPSSPAKAKITATINKHIGG